MNILFAGDFCPERESLPRNPFSEEVVSLFHKSDYVIINLEAPLTERGKPTLKTGPNLRIHPGYAKLLKESGVDCACLANNHLWDFDNEGVEDTIKYCQEAGLDIVGAGMNAIEAARPLIKDIGGQRIAFIAFCEREFSIVGEGQAGANPFNIIDRYYDIVDLQEKVDKVIVIYHGGLEHQHFPSPEMVKAFRFFIDIGADAVIAHHMHAYSGFEVYKEKPIFYGLGNFFFYFKSNRLSDNWYRGLLASLHIEEDIKASSLPTIMDKSYHSVRFAEGEALEAIIRHVEYINSIISEQAKFDSYWEDYYRNARDKVLRILGVRSKSLYRIKKLLKIRPKLNDLQLIMWLNYFRCEAHRENVEAILEQELKKRVS